ncbi:hypothetical protein Q5H93_23515 [Hymenobacter sp. ASUV-10]|uniref:Tail fiber protein n=1 Tax=Hymenobacter aranciens TaxID=3063996 RepID=A0ABT9BHI3_9BACT|nr:hypothetical protein [Hymenobacter sp. ASUV-10]MDO7877725.1 hypothetical protein [Hymenobacter sp. ASUV-10]
MEPYDTLRSQLQTLIRTGGQGGKTTAQDLRTFLSELLDVLEADTDAVQSVNGKTGVVALQPSDLNLTNYSKATTQTALGQGDTVLQALGKLEKKADDAILTQIAYVQRAAPDTTTNKVRFDKNAHYARTLTALTAAHFVSPNDPTNVAGITVRLQYNGNTAPVFPGNYVLVSGAFVTIPQYTNHETVIYLTFIPAAVTGSALVEVTISQYTT